MWSDLERRIVEYDAIDILVLEWRGRCNGRLAFSLSSVWQRFWDLEAVGEIAAGSSFQAVTRSQALEAFGTTSDQEPRGPSSLGNP